jgi:hypothetical protein
MVMSSIGPALSWSVVMPGDRLDLVLEQRRPMVEFARIGIVHGILKLGLVQPRAESCAACI